MKIETPILRRLGPVPFWRGSDKCLDELERIYRRARAAAAAQIGLAPAKGEDAPAKPVRATAIAALALAVASA